MKTFAGKDIREVWDWRLSNANPILYNNEDLWIVRIFDNAAPAGERVLLAEHITDMETVGENGERNVHDYAAIAECYEWLYGVRDQYSKENIEELKPEVAAINAKNLELSEMARA